MSDAEDSPDWLRAFQAPARTFVTLSSASDSSQEANPAGSDESDRNDREDPKKDGEKHDAILIDSGADSPAIKSKKTKSQKTQKDRDLRKDDSPVIKAKKTKSSKTQTDHDLGEDSPAIKTKKTKSPQTQKDRHHKEGSPIIKAQKKESLKPPEDPDVGEDVLDAHDEEPAEEDTSDIPAPPLVSSRLPLVFPEKVHSSKALVECDGDSIDLSGDVGAVGRIVISDGSAGNHEMLLDLKGTVYKSTIVPSRTFCIVSVGQSEAKIEAIMNDFIKLEPHSNVFEAETMIEGTLEGFSFDSDEEGDKMPKPSGHQGDQNNENGDQANPKAKRKAEGSSGMAKKKAKAAVRPSKTVKKAKKPRK